jgi:uncharacterized protein
LLQREEHFVKTDIHCHVIGNGKDIRNVDNDVYLYAEDNQHWLTRILANLVEDELVRLEADTTRDGSISTDEYFALLYKMLCDSEETDGIVLLALDALFARKTGLLDEEKTDLWASNRYLAKKVKALNGRLVADGKGGKKFYLGASVSPNRKDWREELDFADTAGAVLVKLIPSAQHISLADRRHKEFYKTLAAKGMPLLCHVGPEYSFPEGIRNKRLDNFRHLANPLDCGVTVIAAHCASPVFPVIDKNVMRDFFRFMESTNTGGTVRLWADTSALSLSTRLPLIPEILDTFPPQWLVHGTDFPIPIGGWLHLPFVTEDATPKEYVGIVKTKNPFDRDVRIKRAHGFDDAILENAEKVLRMPA